MKIIAHRWRKWKSLIVLTLNESKLARMSKTPSKRRKPIGAYLFNSRTPWYLGAWFLDRKMSWPGIQTRGWGAKRVRKIRSCRLGKKEEDNHGVVLVEEGEMGLRQSSSAEGSGPVLILSPCNHQVKPSTDFREIDWISLIVCKLFVEYII